MWYTELAVIYFTTCVFVAFFANSLSCLCYSSQVSACSASEGTAVLSSGAPAAAAVLPVAEKPRCPSPLPEYSAADEAQAERDWMAVGIEGMESAVNVAAIQDYRRIVTHGGKHLLCYLCK